MWLVALVLASTGLCYSKSPSTLMTNSGNMYDKKWYYWCLPPPPQVPANPHSLRMASCTTSHGCRLSPAPRHELRAESQPEHHLLSALARRCISPERFSPEEEECLSTWSGQFFVIYSSRGDTGEKASRRRRSKPWRSPSSPQIHQKYIYMWNNSYRTPTEQKTSDFPKDKRLHTYLGRAKEKRETKE